MYIQDVDLKLKDWAFAQRKNLPYTLKLQLTKARVIEWDDSYDGDVYVSFSGGLDSTVLLDIVRKELGEDVPGVFCNTGLEFPELVQFVKTIPNIEVIRPQMSFRKVLLDYGYPLVSKETAAKIRKLRHGKLGERYKNYLLNGDERGKLGKLADKWKFLVDAPFDTSEKCCDVMKKKPFKEYHKRTGRYPFIGTTQDEGFQRQRQYERTGCNVYDSKTPKSQPLGFWTKQDVLRYAHENKLAIAPVYGEIKKLDNGTFILTGEQRTGCVFCAFGAHMEKEPNRFQRLQKTHPQLWSYCMKDKEEGGLSMAKVLKYAGIPYKKG